MMYGLVLTNLEPIVILFTHCRPIKKLWGPSTSGTCWPTRVRIYSVYVQVAYSVTTDLICAFLPADVLWNVKISPNTKFGVCALMSSGLLATVTAIIRASSLGTRTVDMSYDYCIAAIWANTELHLGIIATNLALGRMVWSFFTKDIISPRHSHTVRYSIGSGNATSLIRAQTVIRMRLTTFERGTLWTTPPGKPSSTWTSLRQTDKPASNI
ncbi:hypothetical protein BU25DRAFT_444573 [Macroventuria anomochaeta]|uniref:Uncharacterized protein n=1 Tax=Macroventuria anomochaeta TaxID=301207 RepID=A0ACB6SI59_9PLEO|nr:uncharacterized protein BU25DRAFT_444573 [Macroventuria anomochaeta]KAF2633975.1 hypothetical protein BU25DRAFT_444573 [Macroventuria anomochaeta]